MLAQGFEQNALDKRLIQEPFKMIIELDGSPQNEFAQVHVPCYNVDEDKKRQRLVLCGLRYMEL